MVFQYGGWQRHVTCSNLDIFSRVAMYAVPVRVFRLPHGYGGMGAARRCSATAQKVAVETLKPPPVVMQLDLDVEESGGKEGKGPVGMEKEDQEMARIYTQLAVMRRTRFPEGDSVPKEEQAKRFSTDRGILQLGLPKLKNDWIGPVNPISNLHPVIFCIPENETALERCCREKKESVQRWNQEYWYQHNMIHRIERDAFVQQCLREKYPDGKVKCSTLTADEMADFFKKFSNSMHNVHAEYSQLWYRRNLEIVWLSVMVWCQRMWRRLKRN